MFVPEAELPLWVICYIPVFMSFLNILPAPKSFPFIVPYLLFENTMSVTKFNAMVSGLFQLGSSYEWVVTKKAGRSSESDLIAAAERDSKPFNHPHLHRGVSESELSELNRLKEQLEAPSPVKKTNRIYRKELSLAFLLLTASVRSLLSAQGIHFYFLLFQGVTFLLVGLDLIGEQMSWGKKERKKRDPMIYSCRPLHCDTLRKKKKRSKFIVLDSPKEAKPISFGWSSILRLSERPSQ